MPTSKELIAFNRTEDEIAEEIGADAVIFQVTPLLRECARMHFFFPHTFFLFSFLFPRQIHADPSKFPFFSFLPCFLGVE
jgi:glutamine phosphoribosylpyrophosphate amidotransferase